MKVGGAFSGRGAFERRPLISRKRREVEEQLVMKVGCGLSVKGQTLTFKGHLTQKEHPSVWKSQAHLSEQSKEEL